MHTESKHKIECTYCDRTFKSSEARDQHERTKHNFSCNICDRQFGSREALDQHEEAKHSGYECRYCDREFASDGARIQHQNAKHAPRPPSIFASSYSSSLPPYAQAVRPVPAEQPSVNIFLGASSTRESKPESESDGGDVLMAQTPPEVKPEVNFACGACGEAFATILAFDAHVSRHGPDSCACTICERADRPCGCVICKRTDTLVNETVLDRGVSGELEETALSVDSLGPVKREDSMACDFVMTLESQGTTDSSAHDMDVQDEEPSPELKHEVYGGLSHDLTPTHSPLPPRHSLDDSTRLSEVVMSLTEESSITDLQLDTAPMECDTIPCEVNIREQHSAPDAHSIVQDLTVYERMRSNQPDVPLDSTNSQSEDHNMFPSEVSNDQLIVLDMDMSHEQVDNPPDCDPCVPRLEPDITHSTESPENGTKFSATLIPVQVHSAQFIGSLPSEVEPPPELGDHFTRNLVPSPTPSEHGSFRPPSNTQDDRSHSAGYHPQSPLTSEGSAGYFSDADRSSTPSSPLSDRSVVFVSADSIPEYVRENRAYLVATSAPSQPSSATSSCVHLPSVVTSSGSLPPQQEHNDGAEVPPADSPSGNGRSSLYCRVCLRDPSEDVTATMCGHVFCNRCIIDAVMARSACPVCATPTLLYCLFRLDI